MARHSKDQTRLVRFVVGGKRDYIDRVVLCPHVGGDDLRYFGSRIKASTSLLALSEIGPDRCSAGVPMAGRTNRWQGIAQEKSCYLEVCPMKLR